MAGLLLPRRWRTAPQQAVELDRTHPLARGLVAAAVAVPNGFVDIVTGRFFRPATFAHAATQRGMSIDYTGADAMDACNFPFQPAKPAKQTSYAAGIIYDSTNTANNASVVTWGASGTQGVPGDLGIINGSVRANALTTGGYVDTSGATALTAGQYYDIAATSQANSGPIKAYLNGLLDGSSTSNSGDFQTSSNKLGLFSNYATNQCGHHGILYAYVWSERILTPGEVLSIKENPFQILAPMRQYVFLASVAAGGTPVGLATETDTALALTGGVVGVGYDAVSESHTGTTGSASEATFSWSHVPVGTPKGIVVFTFCNASADITTAVTYGGVSMTAVPSGVAADTATEAGTCKAWFLGSSVPTGTQTVEVTRTNNATTIYAVAVSVQSDGNTEVTGVTLQQENQAPAEANIDDGSPGKKSLRLAGANYGGSAIPVAGANSTALIGIDYGLRTVGVVRETLPGQGARPVGFADGTDDWAAVLLAVRISAQSAAVGMASETDAALTLSVARPADVAAETDSALALGAAVATGLAAEIDTALALTPVQITATGIAAETDSAQTLGVARPADVSVETDTALALGSALPAGLSSETDSAQTLAAVQITATGLSSEVDTSLALEAGGTPVGLAVETDASLALIPIQITATGAALESDSSQLLGVARPADVASETDSAQALGIGAPVSLASETDTALALSPVQSIVTGLASETDSSVTLAVARPADTSLETDAALALGVTRPADIALESDAALALGGVQLLATGLGTETDTAQALAAVQIIQAGIAFETDTALALASGQSLPVGTAPETDTAQPLGVARPVDLALEGDTSLPLGSARPVEVVPETDTALPLNGVAIGSIGVGAETDAALALGAVQSLVVGIAAETDEALALSSNASAGTALETDTALALGVARPVDVGVEVDTALALGSATVTGLASEVDSAFALSPVSIGSVGVATESDTALAPGASTQVGLALETDVALALGIGAPVGVAAETNEALTLGVARPVSAALEAELALALGSALPIGISSEVDVALELGAGVSVGVASETDGALALGVGLSVGMALELDTALPPQGLGVTDQYISSVQARELIAGIQGNRPGTFISVARAGEEITPAKPR